MKVQQKVVFNVGTQRFCAELQEHLDAGWRVVPNTIEHGVGDWQLCVVEHDVPEKMPCFEAESPKV